MIDEFVKFIGVIQSGSVRVTLKSDSEEKARLKLYHKKIKLELEDIPYLLNLRKNKKQNYDKIAFLKQAGEISEKLNEKGITAEILYRGKIIAIAGKGANPKFLSKLGIKNIEIRDMAILMKAAAGM